MSDNKKVHCVHSHPLAVLQRPKGQHQTLLGSAPGFGSAPRSGSRSCDMDPGSGNIKHLKVTAGRDFLSVRWTRTHLELLEQAAQVLVPVQQLDRGLLQPLTIIKLWLL